MKIRMTSLALIALLCGPILVALLAIPFEGKWFPAGDMAQAELHMRGFFRHPPLVGAAGRSVSDSGIQGSHPGPSLWVAMLPVYLIGGRSSAALMAAAASVHIVSVASIIWLCFRRARLLLALPIALALIAILRSSGNDFMIEPWNPWLALLPFGVFLLLVYEVIDPVGSPIGMFGRSIRPHVWAFAVAAVLVGSHCVQSHAGYVLLVVPLLGFMVGFLLLRSLRDRRAGLEQTSRALRKAAIASIASAVIAWSPAFLDQWRRKPGNLTILLQHFGSPEEQSLDSGRVAVILKEQLNLVGPWLVGPHVSFPSFVSWAGCVGFFALVLTAGITAWSRGCRSQICLFGVLGVSLALGVVSLTRIFGPFFEYTVRWVWLLVAFSVSASAWVLLSNRVSRAVSLRRIGDRHIVFTSLGVLLAFSGFTSLQVFQDLKIPGEPESRILAGLIEEVENSLEPDETYQVRFYDPYTLNATGFGLVLELERRGFAVKVDPEFAAAALPHRTAPMSDVDRVLWIVVGPAIVRADADPALNRLAYFNPRSREQQARSQQLLSAIEVGLREAGRTDLVQSLASPGASILFADPPLPEETAALVRELISMGQPTAVYSMSIDVEAESLR